MSDELWAGLGGGLIGGVLGAAGAIIAVIVDRRIERRNRTDEEARQLGNVAKALALEIDGFAQYCGALLISLRGVSRQIARQILLELPPSHPLPIYTANANRVGEFQADEIAAIVAFFNSAERILSAVNEGAKAQELSYASDDQNANSPLNVRLTELLVDLAQKRVPRAISCASSAKDLLLKRAVVAIGR